MSLEKKDLNYVVCCLAALLTLALPVMGDSHGAIPIAPEEDSTNPEELLSDPDSYSVNTTEEINEDSPESEESDIDESDENEDTSSKRKDTSEDRPQTSRHRPASSDSEEDSLEEQETFEEFVIEEPQTENAILPVPTETNVITTGTSIRNFLVNGINGENAILLITGGLFIVVFVLGASIFNTFFDTSDIEPGSLPFELSSVLISPLSIRAGRVKTSIESGIVKAKDMKIRSLDDIFDSIVALGIGDPRIVSSSKRNKTLRIYNCIECEKIRARREFACDFTKGFLTGGFRSISKGSIEVEETKCCGKGADYCEYSIVFGR